MLKLYQFHDKYVNYPLVFVKFKYIFLKVRNQSVVRKSPPISGINQEAGSEPGTVQCTYLAGWAGDRGYIYCSEVNNLI